MIKVAYLLYTNKIYLHGMCGGLGMTFREVTTHGISNIPTFMNKTPKNVVNAMVFIRKYVF